MTDIALSVIAGMVLGVTFALIRLPIPAPITLAGVMGVVGVWAGYAVIQLIVGVR